MKKSLSNVINEYRTYGLVICLNFVNSSQSKLWRGAAPLTSRVHESVTLGLARAPSGDNK